MNPAIAAWLWWLMWTPAPRAQCTRCGGSHPLSRCPWPTSTTKGEMDD
nr:hypothetical protein [Massilia sp. PDC64]